MHKTITPAQHRYRVNEVTHEATLPEAQGTDETRKRSETSSQTAGLASHTDHLEE
ncbi:hypothetical protein PISMIDRAFT_674804 [Pisolithus microcarpus 441]|uniref:Uncharacterized protein n=1 Tax=Pisolithus microcarpus 441 TaxID=765257 RepID=A0A0C9ZDS9_9AGAM|nr:hypothetical protein PISMIDRAFT_674804 [Pisolithus microcarpus 441]